MGLAQPIPPGEDPQEHVFKPTYNQEQIEQYIQQYRQAPNNFRSSMIDDIENHANHYQVEFHRDLADEEFRILDNIKQAGSGFVSGFTTLDIGEQPKNQWERISRNLGHLAGFVGVVPGAGMAAKATAKSGMMGSSLLLSIANLQGKSVPMLISNKLTKETSKTIRNLATKGLKGKAAATALSTSFLRNKVANDLTEGAFHLGVASAVSSWTYGIDAMVESAMHGAVFGSVFRGIGNLMKSPVPGQNKMAQDIVGGMAGAMFQGLPSTIRGATTPEQITEYLMGAYFGYKEMPHSRKTAHKYVAEELVKPARDGMPVEDLQAKIARDVVERNFDKDEISAIMDIGSDWVNRGDAASVLAELAKSDESLAAELAKEPTVYTDKGEVSAVNDIVAEAGIKKLANQPHVLGKIPKEDIIPKDRMMDAMFDLTMTMQNKNPKELIKDSWLKRFTPEETIAQMNQLEAFAKKTHGAILPSGMPQEGRRLVQEIVKEGFIAPDKLSKPTEKVKREKPTSVSGSGVEYYKDAFKNLDLSYDTFKDAMSKEAIETFAKRKSSWYGDVDYEYSGIKHPKAEMPDAFYSVARSIEKKMGLEEGYFNSALMNVIKKGKGITAHADDEPIFIRDNNTIGKVATVTIGGSSKISISNKKTGKHVDDTVVHSGDLYVMPGQKFQIENQHTVGPASGDRISLTFRHIPKSQGGKFTKKNIKEAPVESEKPTWEPDKALLKRLSNKGFSEVEVRLMGEQVATNLGYNSRKLHRVDMDFIHDKDSNTTTIVSKLTGEVLEEYNAPERLSLDDTVLAFKIGTEYNWRNISSGVRNQVEKTLGFKFKKGDFTVNEKAWHEMSTKLQEKLNEMVEFESLDSEEVARFIKAEFDYDITGKGGKEDKAWYRQYLKRGVQEKPIRVISPNILIDYKFKRKKTGTGFWKNFEDMNVTSIHELHPDNPQNLARNRKTVRTPILPIEEAYQSLMESMGKPIDIATTKDRPMSRVDSVVTEDGNGRYTERTFAQMRELLTRDIDDNLTFKLRGKKLSDTAYARRLESEVAEFTNRIFGGLIKHHEAKGMHYYSGRGDNGTAFFMKYHPSMEKMSPGVRGTSLNAIYRALESIKGSDGKRLHPDSKKVAEADRDAYIEAYKDTLTAKKAKESWERAYLSNYLWEMTDNGFKLPDFKVALKTADINKTLSDGFIANTIAFNKRQQIKLTNGHPVEGQFINKRVTDLGGDEAHPIARVVLTRLPNEAPDYNVKPWDKKNTDFDPHLDGDTTTRNDMHAALLEEGGHPDSGQAKNFIVSPNEAHGSLLAKHMMFDAGELQSNFMTSQAINVEGTSSQGVHFFMPSTSAKQMGTRKSYFHELTKDGFKYYEYINGVKTEVAEPIAYEIPISDIKTVMSEVTSDHSIGETRMPKQVSTNFLTSMFTLDGVESVSRDATKAYFEDIHKASFIGEERNNQLLEEYQLSPNDESLSTIMKNFDKLGTKEVVELMVKPGYHKFTAEAYKKLAKVTEEMKKADVEEGEMSEGESQQSLTEFNEWASVVDRNLQLGAENLSVWFHKTTEPYRATLLRNYITHQITRPRIKHGMTTRMRGYDLELQKRFPELMDNKDLYFLDEGMRDKPVYPKDALLRDVEGNPVRGQRGLLERATEAGVRTSALNKIKKVRTLGELWDIKIEKNKNGDYVLPEKAREVIEEFVEAINVRVPMDSASGAQVLKFGGFTGRKGFGSLIHSEKMEALGGADSDGDKSFIFFGMEGKYKKAFKNVTEEFARYYERNDSGKYITAKEYHRLGTANQVDYYRVVTDNKSEFRNILTKESEYDNPRKKVAEMKHRALMYSPHHRMNIANEASGGRGNLGPAVVQKQTISAAHAASIDSNSLENTTSVFIKEGKAPKRPFDLKYKTRTSDEETQYMRDLQRAGIAFPSDPLDEIGLIHRDKAFVHFWEAAFEPNKADKAAIIKAGGEKAYISALRKTVVEPFSNINSALFGKDLVTGKSWTYDQFKEKLGLHGEVPEAGKNGMLVKAAETVDAINFQDSFANRVNLEALIELYKKYGTTVKSNDRNFKDTNKLIAAMANDMGRGGFPVKLSEAHIRAIENLQNGVIDVDQIKQTNDFLSNDIHNMVGFQGGAEHWIASHKKGTLTELAKFADKIQHLAAVQDKVAESVLQFKVVNKKSGIESTVSPEMYERLTTDYKKIGEVVQEAQTRAVSTDTLSEMIVQFKHRKNKKGEHVFDDNDLNSLDWLFLSGFKTPGKATLKAYKEAEGKERTELGKLVFGTRQTRLPFELRGISDAIVKDFWGKYDALFNEVTPQSKPLDSDAAKARQLIIDGKFESDDVKLPKVEGLSEDAVDAELFERERFVKGYEKTLDKLEGFKATIEEVEKGVKPLSLENKQLQKRLIDKLAKFSNKIGPDLELFMKYELGKSPDAMSLADVKNFERILDYYQDGTWFQKNILKYHESLKSGKEDLPMMGGVFHHMFPRTVDRALLRKEMKLVDAIAPVWQPGDKHPMFRDVKKPQHSVGALQHSVSMLSQISIDAQDAMEQMILNKNASADNLAFLHTIPNWERLHEVAMILHEAPEGKKAHEAAKFGTAADKGKYKDAEKYRYYELNNSSSELSKEIRTLYEQEFNPILHEHPEKMTGREVIDKIRTYWSEKMHGTYDTWMRGDKKVTEKYFYEDEHGIEQVRLRDFVDDVHHAIRSGKKPHDVMNIGLDNMQKMAVHAQIKFTKNAETKKALAKRLEYTETAERGWDADTEKGSFWHHTDFSPVEVRKALNSAMDSLNNKKYTSEADKERLISHAVKLAFQMRGASDSFNLEALKDWGMYNEVQQVVGNKLQQNEAIEALNSFMKARSQKSRSLTIGGWDLSPMAGVKYHKNLADTFYSNMSQIVGRDTIHRFELDQVRKYKKDGKIIDSEGWDNAKNWKTFQELYLNEAMGFPSIIPDNVLNNKGMGIKGTPYHWFADSTVKKRLNKIRNMFKGGEMPENLDKYLDYNKIRHWTNLEAKYQLATLLAHPKTAIANVFGGSTLTIQSTGLRHWLNAQSTTHLKNNIDPSFTSPGDAGRWVEGLGVIEQFITYETGMSPHAKNTKVSKAFGEMMQAIKGDKGVEDVRLLDIWKSSGLGDALFEKAAWFMRKSERKLRRDSFIAHYLQAKDRFGDAITDRDHPFLVEWAKRGVQDTQFLYTAAFRPGFARSSLGKVMTRFQLWAWNSVAFRNKVAREAKMYNFTPGTPEYERFKRTASIDMLVFALASTFTYSMFEANLPAPYNYLQDLGDWLMGDQTTRDRAFFGSYPTEVAPLQLITPPAGRMIGPTIKAMLDDDYSRLSDYYVWTMFPFGRLARDVKNSIENPVRSIESLTGFPYMNLHRFVKEEREKGNE